jgi:hypothetical protein
MKRLLLPLCLLLFALCADAVAQQQHRHALLMGVGDYGDARYKESEIKDLPGITDHDLPKMRDKLQSLGFTVTLVPNPNLGQARGSVEAFTQTLRQSKVSQSADEQTVALFYFSGHGAEYQGRHFLIPKDAYMPSSSDMDSSAIGTQTVINTMEESGADVCLSFLDCCREDLGKNISSASQTRIEAKGTFIGYATRSGDKADPDTQGSPFTRFLLQNLDRPGVSIADMYSHVIKDVRDHAYRVYGEERRPGFYSELDAPFYFLRRNVGREVDQMQGPLAVNQKVLITDSPKLFTTGIFDENGVELPSLPDPSKTKNFETFCELYLAPKKWSVAVPNFAGRDTWFGTNEGDSVEVAVDGRTSYPMPFFGDNLTDSQRSLIRSAKKLQFRAKGDTPARLRLTLHPEGWEP